MVPFPWSGCLFHMCVKSGFVLDLVIACSLVSYGSSSFSSATLCGIREEEAISRVCKF